MNSFPKYIAINYCILTLLGPYVIRGPKSAGRLFDSYTTQGKQCTSTLIFPIYIRYKRKNKEKLPAGWSTPFHRVRPATRSHTLASTLWNVWRQPSIFLVPLLFRSIMVVFFFRMFCIYFRHVLFSSWYKHTQTLINSIIRANTSVVSIFFCRWNI